MKKFSKITSVLLMVLLLCGLVLSFTSSAEETSQLVKTSSSANIINEYEGSDANWYKPWTGYRDGAVDKDQVVGLNGNKYLRMGITKKEFTESVLNAQIGPSANVHYGAYEYTTVDFDI